MFLDVTSFSSCLFRQGFVGATGHTSWRSVIIAFLAMIFRFRVYETTVTVNLVDVNAHERGDPHFQTAIRMDRTLPYWAEALREVRFGRLVVNVERFVENRPKPFHKVRIPDPSFVKEGDTLFVTYEGEVISNV